MYMYIHSNIVIKTHLLRVMYIKDVPLGGQEANEKQQQNIAAAQAGNAFCHSAATDSYIHKK